MGGGQNLERRDLERPIFRNFGWGTKFRMVKCRTNFKITNIKIAKDVLFDYFICEFIFYYYVFKLLEKSICSFFQIIRFYKFSELLNFENFSIFQIKKLQNSKILQIHFEK